MLPAPDLLSAEAVADPYAAFGALREREPVHYNAAHRSWVITRYEDVAAGFLDRRLSSDRVASIYASQLRDAPRGARGAPFSGPSGLVGFKGSPRPPRAP